MAAPNMNNTPFSEAGAGALSREDMQSALFAQLVMQQTNLALMLLGRMPHPQTGETVRDLDAAQMLIGQIEMLEAKTRGNLTADEGQLLKQSLMAVRMAFVEAVEAPAQPAAPAAAATSQPAAAENETAPAESASAAAEEESRKRFSKKY